jgi:RNA polymerase sigma-70 factor (ECF subfamily)
MLRVKNGDLRKMDLLFKRHRDGLFAFLFRMTGQREASEDMTQNIFYRMIRSRHTFTGNGEFKTWMFHLARNVLKDHYRLSSRYGKLADISQYDERIESGSYSNTDIEKKEQLQLLQKAIQSLSTEDREIIVLSRFHELKYHQVAQIMDMSVAAVKTRMHRSVLQLKNMFLKSGKHEM